MLSYPTFVGYSRKVMTLTMILQNGKMLLGMKNRGMGKGKWNGFGGKVEPNETIDDGAKREVKEECGLDVISMDKIGLIEFEYVGSKEILEGHIYSCNLFSGDIIESDEMAPIKWFKVEDSPCDQMWIDHKFWFPMILKKIPFKAHFKYLNDDTMLDSTIILSNSSKKIKESWVNVVIKKDNQIILPEHFEESKYFNKHEKVKSGEPVKDAAIRHLKSHYKIDSVEVQKVAVVDIELIDQPCIQEINVFVLDISKLTKSIQIENFRCLDIKNIQENNLWLDNKFFSTLLMMEPFKAYFLMDIDKILCRKYDNN